MKKIFLLALLALIGITANAQNFGNDKTVNAATTWTFEQLAGKDITSTEEFNGLYLRANGSHAIHAKNSRLKIKLADGKTYKATSYIAPANNGGIAPAASKMKSAGDRISNSNDRSIAFNAAVAGKVYVAFRATTGIAERSLKVFFKGKSDSDYKMVAKADAKTINAQEDNLGYIEYTATEPGTFVIGGDCSPLIYAVQFIPTK